MTTAVRITPAEKTIVTLTIREVYAEWVSAGDVELTTQDMAEASDLTNMTCYTIMRRCVGYGWAFSFIDVDHASGFNCPRRYFVLTDYGREQMINCLNRPRRP